ncbi:hypothetical protein DW961_04570 [Blautia sp. AM46-3MH]|nr:hypothetical protein DW961_04570 [Blautia sp. AM46-3MH]
MESCCTGSAFYECTAPVKRGWKSVCCLVADRTGAWMVQFSALPVSFSGFRDRGYLVAKIFGIAGAGFLMWLGASTGIVPFTHVGCLVSTGVLAAVCWGVWIAIKKQKIKDKTSWKFTAEWYQTVLDDELVFILFFLLWTYVAGFRPAAYGTEKFMDYGFMMAMMRSTTLPAKDLWYAGAKINYYYGGQYFAVFLTKLTNTQVAQTYNLMRTLVAGFCFAVPFALVRQMVLDSWKREKPALLGGALGGAGVSLAGNMHYVVIGKLLPWIREIFICQKGIILTGFRIPPVISAIIRQKMTKRFMNSLPTLLF